MKAWLFVGAAIVAAASALAPMARADGPRPSSENNWPGMISADPGMANSANAARSAPGGAPQYVWQEGYENGGRWHGHWVRVR